MNQRNIIIFLIAFFSSTASADQWSTGLYFGSSNGGFSETGSSSSSHYGIFGYYSANRDIRWGAGIEFSDSTAYSAEVSGIGTTAERTLLSGSYERRFVVTEYVKPYIGFGLIYSENEFTNRFTVDSEGFRNPNESIGDKSQSDLSAQLLLSQEVDVWESIALGLRGRYEVSGDSFSGFSLSASATYRF